MPLRAQFQTKHPKAHTCWLVFTGRTEDFDTASKPGGVMHDLIHEAGWKLNPIPPAPDLDDDSNERDLLKDGTDLFLSWTPAEKRANMAAARAILERHGYPKGMKVRRLTLAEMM